MTSWNTKHSSLGISHMGVLVGFPEGGEKLEYPEKVNVRKQKMGKGIRSERECGIECG